MMMSLLLLLQKARKQRKEMKIELVRNRLETQLQRMRSRRQTNHSTELQRMYYQWQNDRWKNCQFQKTRLSLSTMNHLNYKREGQQRGILHSMMIVTLSSSHYYYWRRFHSVQNCSPATCRNIHNALLPWNTNRLHPGYILNHSTSESNGHSLCMVSETDRQGHKDTSFP